MSDLPKMSDLPSHAEIVVIGGGIIGTSTAYHLARDHKVDVILLEQGQITSGSTWHAAGLVGQLRNSAAITQVLNYSVGLYASLQAETGLATGWKQNGGLRLACNSARWTEIRRQATTAHSFGMEMNLLDPKEARDLWPMMEVSDLVGAAFLPTDGQANPADITQSLARGARNRGVRIVEGVTVTAIGSKNGAVETVVTDKGTIVCEKLVNCAGLWARQIGAMAGVSVPLQAMQHQFMVTEPIAGIGGQLPTLRDPDRLIYMKEEVGGLVFGGYEPNPLTWAENGIPENFQFQLLEDDFDHFEPLMAQALIRVPALETAGIKSMTNGPEAFTPDGNYIMGEAPEVRNFFVGAGFNAYGIAAGGGAGWTLADWVVRGEQPLDLWSVDIRRFSKLHKSADWVRERTSEAYAKHYTMAWPHEEYASGRGRIVSPLYDRLAERGACFGAKLGWERPNWFATEGVEPRDEYSFGRQNWFDAVGAEHAACRRSAALFDQSSFAKFEVSGSHAERALSWLCANDVGKPPGRVTYTQMLNSRGGIECDLTVSRLDEDLFYLVTGTGFRTHDFAWISDHIEPDLNVQLRDVTEQFATLSLMGPNARDILSQVCDADLTNAGFGFGRVREVEICGHRVRALRLTYVGELGWELHMPIAAAGDVFDALMAAGQGGGEANGLVLAGYRAIDTLRMEKGYRAWGADITPNDTPDQAGLGWAVKMTTDVPFLGRDAIVEQRRQPLVKRMACFTVADPEITLHGRETIFRNGAPVGWLTSGNWGHTVGKNIGYGYVRHTEDISDEFLDGGTYALEVACQKVPCQYEPETLYDPHMSQVKA
jgi:glycine cleavage system aminomethyltransferase T/glycine/D-amino acid oxidase-like deaminating enzyme